MDETESLDLDTFDEQSLPTPTNAQLMPARWFQGSMMLPCNCTLDLFQNQRLIKETFNHLFPTLFL